MRREYRPDDTASHRALAGARLTAISVCAGILATVASLGGVAYVAMVGSAATHPDRPAILAVHTEVPRGAALVRRLDGAPDGAARPVREHRVGDVTVIDVGAQIVSLDDELDRQRVIATRNHQRLLLWLVVEDCKPCNALEAAISNVAMQRVLARTRLVRLDAVEFLAELARLGVPMDAFPAFVLLGADGHATDYVHGGEWDDDLPENIAPVLKSFVDGTYIKRRSPWHGGLHEDETALRLWRHPSMATPCDHPFPRDSWRPASPGSLGVAVSFADRDLVFQGSTASSRSAGKPADVHLNAVVRSGFGLEPADREGQRHERLVYCDRKIRLERAVV